MYPIVSAIMKAEKEFLGEHRTWLTTNSMQDRFTRVFIPLRNEIERIPEIRSWAAKNAEELNAVLKTGGFDIQLQPFPVLAPPLYAWGAVSILNVVSKWKVRGKKTTLRTPEREVFTAAHLKEDTVMFFMAEGHKHPIARISTGTEDLFFMTMFEKDSLEHFDLIVEAEKLTKKISHSYEFSGLVFPFVDLDQRVDISWLKGMQTIDSENFPNEITQALQQTKLKLNEFGAKVESAVAIAGVKGYTASISTPKLPHIINKPFLIWMRRPGLSQPLFVGHITKEDWKDPHSIG